MRTRYCMLLFFLCSVAAHAIEPCRIDIVDDSNGWPVPLVELRTVHQVRFVSDNAGVIAFDLPELMGVRSWFFVEGHGYEVKADGFGYRGVRLTPEPGGRLTVKVKRTLPGKRLGRITGAGLFGESQKLGLHLDFAEQGILGCDSVQNAVHNGKLFWAWGDTNLARHPLGIFHMIGAVTETQPLDSFEPPVRLRYDYFTGDKGVREIARMPGEGPTWLDGFLSLPDASGRHRLVAHYVKIKPPLTVYESGLCVWNETTERFDRRQVLWEKGDGDSKPTPAPRGHPVIWADADGKRWAMFGDPFPALKCEPTFEAWENPDRWTLLEPQPTVPSKADGQPIRPHRGSIAWNDYREKWVVVFCQNGGDTSYIGELWYAEADAPTGPWRDAVKVVTHNNYTFYNPRLHPEFTPKDSPILLFEATYTKTFAKNAHPTPRCNYNQVLYRVDLNGVMGP